MCRGVAGGVGDAEVVEGADEEGVVFQADGVGGGEGVEGEGGEEGECPVEAFFAQWAVDEWDGGGHSVRGGQVVVAAAVAQDMAF